MAKITDNIINDTQERILEGNDLADIRKRLRDELGYSGAQINTIILKSKDAIHERVTELKDILPELNLYRLNDLYVTSVNAPSRDRAAIVREMNQMLNIYKQDVDLDVRYSFVINADDEVEVENGKSE